MLVGTVVVLSFLALVPVVAVLGFPLSNHDLSRILQLCLGGACTLLAVPRISRCRDATLSPPIAAVTLVALAFSLASAAQADVPAMAWREMALLAGLGSVTIVIAHGRDAVSQRSMIIGTLSATFLYTALLFLLLCAIFLAGKVPELLDFFVGYDNYRFYSHVQTVALPLAALAATRLYGSRLFALMAWFCLGLGFAFVLFATARGTTVGVVGGSLCALAFMGRRAWPIVSRLMIGAALGAVAYAIIFVVLPGLMQFTAPDATRSAIGNLLTDNARFYLWRIALADIVSSPWFGTGPMHFAHVVNEKAAHPHNVYLQVGAEWGLPMLGMLASLAAIGLWRLARTVRGCASDDEAHVGAGLFIACVAVAIDGAFAASFAMPISQVWIALLVGWSVAWWRRNANIGQTQGRRIAWATPLRVAVAASLVASQVWLAATVWSEVRDLDAYLERALEMAKNAKRNPRFWSHGWF